MKIQNSNVVLSSEHRSFNYDYQEAASIEMRSSQAATLEFSPEAEDYVKELNDYKKNQNKSKAESDKAMQQKASEQILKQMEEARKNQKVNNQINFKPEEELQIRLLKKLLAALRNGGKGFDLLDLEDIEALKRAHRNNSEGFKLSQEGNEGISLKNMGTELPSGDMTINTPMASTYRAMTRITAVSGMHAESETTTFAGKGLVKTADGRDIEFNVELGMSRSFTEKFSYLSEENYTVIVCDPLVINLDGGAAKVTDQKFFFDLDADGKEEAVSMATGGSGFLALDKNDDGKINDGSELFGPQSGNGFVELAKYDEDGNGWIDENDSVFDNLKVFSVDEDGTQHLIALGKAGVGAIYLGNTETEFALANEENQKNGYIRSTGVYLKENGGAGTIQHVDLTL